MGFNTKKRKYSKWKKYIEFLCDKYNSIHAITFDQDGNKLFNIDENNRINAIIHYLEEPFVLFPEKINKLKNFIIEKINNDIACEVENIIKKMRYDELMTFKYNTYFIDKNHVNLYNNHLKSIRDEFEPFFDELSSNIK